MTKESRLLKLLSLRRNLLLWLTASSAAAFCWPQLRLGGATAPFDPFLASAEAIHWIVAAAMFFVGWMLPARQVEAVVRRGHLVAAGTALQYLSMPLLAWCAVRAFQLQDEAWIGMQNAGVGTMLAIKLFGEATALAPALYTFGCMFTGTVLARWWHARPCGQSA